MTILKRLITLTDQTLFPSFCLNCKKDTPENPPSLRWLCVECHRLLLPKLQSASHKPKIAESFYIFDYEKDKLAQKVIRALKYGWVKDLAETLYVYLEKERLNIKKLEFDLIIPMPLHRYRLKERGFNQSKLIADKIAEITKKEICEDIIKRKIHKKPQAEIKKRDERAKNISGIFKIIDADKIAGKTILIVDDVATTGATLKECARVLKDSGAEKIVSFTLAQD
jgi:ComF family protein